MKKVLATCGAVAALAFSGAAAHAAAIIAPKNVTVISGGQAGGPGSSSPWWVGNIINQTGLNKSYVSGVTDFDAFIASNPIHNTGAYSEWNSSTPITGAQLLFDFGEEVTLGALAWWDEDASSVSNIYLSKDGAQFAKFGVVDTRPGSFYGAQVFNFKPITTRYLTLNMDGCNKGGFFNHAGCGIGEIAFKTAAQVGAVPEPSTWATMILGFFGVGATLRSARRRQGGLLAVA